MQAGRVERYDFGSGYAATRGTVKLLADAVRTYHTHPRIRARALSIVTGLQSMDYDGEVQAVWDFILSHVRYTRDPLFAEYVTSPALLDEMVDQGTAQEDCEGIALYAATLLASIGRVSEFSIFGKTPGTRKFSHCALRVQNPVTKAWTEFDPVGAWAYSDFGLGDSVGPRLLGPVERWSLDGKREALAGLLDDEEGCLLGDALDQTADVANPIADAAMGLGPYGMIAGGLVKGGLAVGGWYRGKQRDEDAKRQPYGSVTPTGPQIKPRSATKGATAVNKNVTKRTTSAESSGSPTSATNLLIVGGVLVAAKLLGVL